MARTLAIALGYRPESDLAPRVVATGSGALAERLIAIAASQGIDIERDRELATLLEPLDRGDEVPEELYIIVARVFAHLDHVARLGEAGMPEGEGGRP